LGYVFVVRKQWIVSYPQSYPQARGPIDLALSSRHAKFRKSFFHQIYILN
jgi:hypothetical protein